jgi:hypothetical protein
MILTLATKPVISPAVKKLQRRLAGNNPWKKNFHPGKIDGEYGKQTAGAVFRAKHYMGYSWSHRNQTAGEKFQDLLSGEKKLPATYALRRKKRIRASKKSKTMQLKALSRMRSRIGLAETPQGSNRNWLTACWYSNKNVSAAWCAISVSEAYIFAGSKSFSRGRNYAYVPYLEHAGARGDSGIARIPYSAVRPGDIVTFQWGKSFGQHVGIVDEVVNSNRFTTIEGNTDSAGGAEGGEQMERTRTVSEGCRFYRVLR